MAPMGAWQGRVGGSKEGQVGLRLFCVMSMLGLGVWVLSRPGFPAGGFAWAVLVLFS